VNFEIYVFASLISAKGNGASADGFRRSGGLLQRSVPLQVEIYRSFLRQLRLLRKIRKGRACYKMNTLRKEEKIAYSFLKVLVIYV